jgi:hypothetical protein
MEAGKEIGDKKLQEIVWSFSSSIPPRIVVECGIKKNIKHKFYQQTVADRASSLRHNWTIFAV